jgi:uncharacterized protein YbbK (DUF523 family)
VKPRVGVSACLLGERVRYDGQDKRQSWAEELTDRVEWAPVCPEVELGLGVPRETIQIEAGPSGVSLMTTATRRDLTKAMRDWAVGRVEELAASGLDGYIFKARSPSCGLSTAPIAGSAETRDGLFAEAVRKRLPQLPLTDEEALKDPREIERFLRLAEARRDWRLSRKL